jgi:UDP-glucose 4-epimerase
MNNVKKVLFASSGGVVYGDAAVIPTPEDYNPLRPLSPYGVAKLTSENYLYYYYKTYGIKYVALRYANIYGPRQDPYGEAGVVAIFTQKMLKNEQPVINGDGLQTRDYTFVGDVVMANIKALSTDYNGPLNIGTSIQTNVNTIYRLLLKLTGSTVKEIHGPAKLGEQQKSCLDITFASKTIGYKPETSLTQGLVKTVAYFKSI